MHMFMTTVVAVALGFAPVNQDGSVGASRDNYATIVGRYSQTVDRNGTTHLRGFNRLTGAPYDLAVKTDGNVEGDVGAWHITFQVKDAA
jgi:hypothetical protein